MVIEPWVESRSARIEPSTIARFSKFELHGNNGLENTPIFAKKITYLKTAEIGFAHFAISDCINW